MMLYVIIYYCEINIFLSNPVARNIPNSYFSFVSDFQKKISM